MTELQSLQATNKYLLKQKQKLLDELRTQYESAHKWLKEHNVDVEHLGEYSKKIALAILITTSVSTTNVYEPESLSTTYNREQVESIASEEIRNLSDEDQARVVWFRYGRLIKESARKYNVDEKLIFSTIMLESRGDTFAYRYEPHINDASYGLGQILYGTARGLGFEGQPEDLYDPAANIDLIAKYHRRNMDVYGNNLTAEQLTIAYNAGSPYSSPHPGHLQKFRGWYSTIKVVTKV